MNKSILKLSFRSEAGDFVGQGQTRDYDRSVDVATVSCRGDDNVVEVFMDFGNGETWSVDFAAPKGQKLRVGEYLDATRYPFQAADRPGFNISGEGRGSNNSFGGFVIHAISFDRADQLVMLIAEFFQRSERITAPALVGSIQYYRKPITSQIGIQPIAIEGVLLEA